MKEQSSLSRRATEALRRLAGREPSQSPEPLLGSRPEEGLICLECSQLNPSTASFCRQCGQPLQMPIDRDIKGYLRAVDLLRSGELSASDVRDLLEGLRREYTFYTAGTRYSVFGPLEPGTPAWEEGSISDAQREACR
jgi:ribosomal protein L40E